MVGDAVERGSQINIKYIRTFCVIIKSISQCTSNCKTGLFCYIIFLTLYHSYTTAIQVLVEKIIKQFKISKQLRQVENILERSNFGGNII